MLIKLSQLDLTTSIDSGGQGFIHEVDPALASAIGWPGSLIAKRYPQSLPEPALADFLHRVRWAGSLPAEARAELYRAAAWPLMVIEDHGALAGIVMPDERERFGARYTSPSEVTKTKLMSLEHVLSGDAYLQRRFDVKCDTYLRAVVAERLATALAVLHRHAIVASDISHKNVLVRLAEPYAVTFIDCDSMTFQGTTTLKLVETPDWEMPEEWGEQATTRAADAYKLGLGIMRLFARQQSLRDLDSAQAHVPTALHHLIRIALSPRPASRPSVGRWQAALRDVLETFP